MPFWAYGHNALEDAPSSREIPFPAALPGSTGQEKPKRIGILGFFRNRRLLIHGAVKNLFVILMYPYAHCGHSQIFS